MLIRAMVRRAVWAADEGGGAAAGGAAGGVGAPASAPAGAAPAAPVAFAETLPEDIRGEAAFRDIKDLGSLAKSYLAAQRMVGDPSKFVKLPVGPDDTDGWSGLFAKLGRPEAADKYPLKAPDGVTVDPKLQSAFQDAAWKAGLSAQQAQGLMDWWNATAGAATQAQAQARQQQAEAGIQALKAEWGAAFDRNLQLAKQAVDHYGGAKLQAELDATGQGNNPELARVLAKIGSQLQEDGILGKDGGGASSALSPAEAQQQINALQADPAFRKSYLDRADPGHADAVAKMTRLYQFKAPQAA